jgi:hypothetical protein
MEHNLFSSMKMLGELYGSNFSKKISKGGFEEAKR